MTGPVVRLGIRVRAAAAETALADLLPLLAGGAEERRLDGAVEYALYLPEGELPPPEAIRALAGDALLGTVTEPVGSDWERRHLAHLRRVSAGPFTIRPPWLDGAADDLVIDPGVTFGAGTHESTRLALALLAECPPGGALCDWGAGSGVLAIAAARLGWDPVTAVELDPRAAAVVAGNAGANGVQVRVVVGDLLRDPLPAAATVVANLTPDLHRGVAARLAASSVDLPAHRDGKSTLSPPARLIAAGFLARHADEVAPLYAPLQEVSRRTDGEWGAVVLA